MGDKKAVVKRTKLDLIHNAAEYVSQVRSTECRTYEYDVKKIMSKLNCSRSQADTLIVLAQTEDARPAQAASAGGKK